MSNEIERLDEVLNFFSYDKKAIDLHLQSGKALCMVFNKDLAPQAIAQAIGFGYVLTNPYVDEERLVVAFGCYRQPVKRFDMPDPKVVEKCSKAKELMDGAYAKKIFKAFIEPSNMLVLEDSLSDTAIDMFKRNYETSDVEYNGKTHTAVACVYYDPNYKTDGKVIAQWYT